MAKRQKITLRKKQEMTPSGESRYATGDKVTQHRGPSWCGGCLQKLSRAPCRCADNRARRAAELRAEADLEQEAADAA